MNTFEKDKIYIAATYTRYPVEIVRGEGSYAWDVYGKRYIDMGSGIAVNIFGFCDTEWTNCVVSQLYGFSHTSNLYFSEPCVTLAEILCERTGFKKVFFANSGAEANECAIKTARKYYFDKYGKTGKIITLTNSFHGRTLATLAATGQEALHKDFQPLPEGFLYTPANDVDSFNKLLSEHDDIAAVMFELIQGEGGVIPLNETFVENMVGVAKQKDILLIADEVQTGCGRTGKLFCYMNYGFMPDILTTAKGLGGGLPIGACLLGDKTEDTLTSGSHGSTFGGNPVVCSGAINILGRIDGALMENVMKKSRYIVGELKNAPGVISINGRGLMLGVKTAIPSAVIIEKLIKRGVLVLNAHGNIRLLPALNIPNEVLSQAVVTIKEVIKEETNGF